MRLARLAVRPWPLALLAAVGCFGGAHNPGYFPHWIPPGDVIQTHAKPPGRSYFKDFDPRAVRLDLVPASGNPATGPQVFVATVFDGDGVARRGRRVEWMLDGPGHLVEVDESGWTAGRGYKVSNRYGVSYTDYFEHTLGRGNTDKSDDFTVSPGQTWCAVAGAVAGETTLTAYAPGVFDWEKGRVSVPVEGGGGGGGGRSSFDFPRSTTARLGGHAPLNTTILKVAEKEGVSPSDLRVRYRAAGGVPVEFEPPRWVSGATAGSDWLEFSADPDGRAAVKVKQPAEALRPGKSDIAVEILKPDPAGGAAKVVGRSNTAVEWVAPGLQLELVGPKTVAVNKDGTVTLVVSNTSKVEGSPGTIDAGFQEGLDVGGATPAPDKARDAFRMAWTLPALPPGGKHEIKIPVRATAKGAYTVAAAVGTDDGLADKKRITLDAGTAALKLALDPSHTAVLGERVPVKLTVTNTGGVPLDTATAGVQFGGGLEHASGEDQAEATVGVIPPGESKSVTIPLVARKTGVHKLTATVRAGDVSDAGETSIDVRRVELTATVSGPERLAPGADGLYEIGVANKGDAAVPNVTVRAVVPGALSVRQVSDDGTINGQTSAVWRIGDLAPGTSKVVKLSARAERTLDKGAITATAGSGDAANPKDPRAKADAALTSVKTDAPVSVQGQPALLLELADPRESVPVGRRAAYRVVLKNQGTAAAKNVRVMVQVPDEYANARGVGPDKASTKPEGSKLIFPAVKEIAAGGTATFTVEVEGAKAGDARVRAEVQADYLTKPLSEEQSTKVVERAR